MYACICCMLGMYICKAVGQLATSNGFTIREKGRCSSSGLLQALPCTMLMMLWLTMTMLLMLVMMVMKAIDWMKLVVAQALGKRSITPHPLPHATQGMFVIWWHCQKRPKTRCGAALAMVRGETADFDKILFIKWLVVFNMFQHFQSSIQSWTFWELDLDYFSSWAYLEWWSYWWFQFLRIFNPALPIGWRSHMAFIFLAWNHQTVIDHAIDQIG